MIRVIIALVLFLIVAVFSLQAQEQTFEEKAKILSNRIEKITSEERAELKEAIKSINKRLKTEAISEVEAQQLKKDAAEKSALQIQNRVSVIEKQLLALVQHKVDNELFLEENRKRFSIGSFDIDYSRTNRKYGNRNYRTTSSFVLAFGLNNLVTDQSLNALENSEFEFWKSRFFEWGINNKTRVFKNNSLVYVNYGFSVMYNTLRPKHNQYYVVDGNTTNLQTHGLDLNKLKFKNVQLVFPLFLELDFSKSKLNKENNKIRYRVNRGFRMGLGGFVGVRIKTKQILKYKVDGKRTRDVQKGDFNTNNFVYGLNAFIGHKDTSFYVKYNINELFKNNITDQNNISFGIRFDL